MNTEKAPPPPTYLVVGDNSDNKPHGWRVEAWYDSEDEADAAANLLKHADRASSPAEAKCVKCKHTAGVRPDGTCAWGTADRVACCGCHCEFPTATAIAAREAAREIVADAQHIIEGSDDEGKRLVIASIISKHCSPVSGDVISRAGLIAALREDSLCQAGCGHTHKASYISHVANLIEDLPAVQPVAAGGEAMRDYQWSVGLDEDESECAILEGERQRILAFVNESTARQLVKRHNAALEAIEVKGEK